MRRAQAYLIPLFFFACLALLGVSLMVFGTQIFGEDLAPRVGEKQLAVFNAYQDADAVKHYARAAAQNAVDTAARTGELDAIEEEVANEFERLMRSHPTHPVYIPFEAEATTQGFRLTSEQLATVPVSYAQSPKDLATSGVFSRWPVPLEQNDHYILSIFGKRDLEGAAGSTNHPGIDLPAPLGTPVHALAAGAVRTIRDNNIYLEYDNGFTCGFYHVAPNPQLQEGDRVEAGEQVARVTKDEPYGLHVDLRCYKTQDLLLEGNLPPSFEGHAASNSVAPADTTYVAWGNAPAEGGQSGYIDPYCLFSQNIQLQVQDAYERHGTQDTSGLKTRNGEGLEEKLSETCQAYAREGILQRAESDELPAAFTQALIEQTLEHEGGLWNEEDGPGWTNYGVTKYSLAEYRGVEPDEITKADIAELERAEARQLLLDLYLFEPGIDTLPPPIIPNVFDSAVNQGPEGARTVLQQTLTEQEFITQDEEDLSFEELAPYAREALAAGVDLNDAFTDARIERYEATEQSQQRGYLDTWKRRSESYRAGAQYSQLALQSQAAGAYGSYSFEISATAQMGEQQQQAISRRTQLRNAASNCGYDNMTCIHPELPENYARCTAYEQQVLDTWSRCSTSCDCRIALPQAGMQQEFWFDTESLHVNDTVTSIDWSGLGGESSKPVYLGIQGFGDRAINVSYADEQLTLRFDDRQQSLPVSDAFYVRVTENPDNFVAMLTNQSQNACETPVMQRYCHTEREESVRVLH